MAQLIDTTVNGDLTVTGSLAIQGTTTTVDTTNLAIADNIVVLNNGESGAGITLGSAGLDIDRGTETNAQFLFDDSIDVFTTNFGLNVGGSIKENGSLLSTLYESSFSKNTGFNKNLGTTTGTVSEGDHLHTFASLTSKPTTVVGFGITDAVQEGDSATLTGDVTGTADFDANGDVSITSSLINPKNIPARNCVVNQEPVTQAISTQSGISATLYNGTGSATPTTVTTGVAMTGGTLGGLVWLKSRDSVYGHGLFDTVRGTGKLLNAALNSIEVNNSAYLSSFSDGSNTGFTVGDNLNFNANEDYMSWSFQTNKQITGTTNRNISYTCHYNVNTGFSISGWTGDGIVGHEVPHHLGQKPELTIIKCRSHTNDWLVTGKHIGIDERGDYVFLNTSGTLQTATDLYTILKDDKTLALTGSDISNGDSKTYIAYNFVSIPGVSKVGTYTGSSIEGRFIECGFRPNIIIRKRVDSSSSWFLYDVERDRDLYAEVDLAEGVDDIIDVTDNGFTLTGTNLSNTIGVYVYMAFAQNDSATDRTFFNYEYPTTADTLEINTDTIVSVANGFSASGQVDTQHQFAGTETYTFGSGEEDAKYWLYSSKTGALGVTDIRPLVGWSDRNDADTWGRPSRSDPAHRTTVSHKDYTSSTGTAQASGYTTTYYPWSALNFDEREIEDSSGWIQTTVGTCWWQYKQTEKRILKSWRFRSEIWERLPQLFTIQGSDDGYTWSTIDGTYTASSYVHSSQYDTTWGTLHTTGSTTAYLYIRINITANGSDATYTGFDQIELNTILDADYYLAEEGKMYNSSGTAIERTYLAEMVTDTVGDVSSYKNLSPSRQNFGTVEIHKDLTVRNDMLVSGNIGNRGVATAWVNFDPSTFHVTIKDSYNIKDVIELSSGSYRIIFEEPYEKDYCAVGASAGEYAVSANVGMSLNTYPHAGSPYQTQLDIVVRRRDTATAVETHVVNVVIFGGKENN